MPRRLTAKERAIRDRNRANARKSTGPRTAAGKRRSSMNGLRHGLWSVRADPTDDAAVAARAAALADLVAADNPAAAAVVVRLARAWHRLDLAERLEQRLLEALAGGEGAPGAALVTDARACAEFAAIDRFRSRARRELAHAGGELMARRGGPGATGGVGGAKPDPRFFEPGQAFMDVLGGRRTAPAGASRSR